MPPVKKFQVTSNPVVPVSAHAWNADRSEVAFSPNNNEVKVLKNAGPELTPVCELAEEGLDKGSAHEQRVTAIDWAPQSNCIVTCGQDRNAYVWNYDAATKIWKPVLVILRINRAATCVKWSPAENKFAVGSGARLISVCYFEEENNWWVSKHIKKPIRSTVLSLDWHPNNILLAAGSSDFKARVFSTFLKGIEDKPGPTAWGKKMPFGEVMGEFGTSSQGGGWVHDVSFSASGDKLAYVSHDSAVTVVNAADNNAIARIETTHLPFCAVQWLTENSFVAAGHGYAPIVFNYDGSAITEGAELDVKEQKAAKTLTAMDKFKSMDRKGTAGSDATDTSVATTHQNAILEIRVYAGTPGAVQQFSTAGCDGQIVVWNA